MKQTTLTSYPAFNRPGQEGNPLVIDSDDNTSNAVDCSSDIEFPNPGTSLKDAPQPSKSGAIAQGSDKPSPTECVGIQSTTLEKSEGTSKEPNPDASSDPTDPDFTASTIDPTSKSSDSELPIPGTLLKDSQQPSQSQAIAQDSTRSSPLGCDQIQSKALEKLEDTLADPEIDASSKSTDSSLLAKIGDPSTKTSCSEIPNATKDAQQASGLDRVVDECSLAFPTGPDGLTHKGPGNPEGMAPDTKCRSQTPDTVCLAKQQADQNTIVVKAPVSPVTNLLASGFRKALSAKSKK
ncbi:hypothetical protein PGTUg99_001325 [Puccinia graminis f. sp. tritici]|uniref:Uncharacterized protein n=1 Tax=Puccinia graminis f. sp. tritici TaxID=56615 RepID=A0A5B0M0P8_PUCGR|nr:hypothetical protein PGTUg99_002203 [Puccinia graminis f. sp. tritici]KAA1111214.1 hypothetical protein PGTUg99_001325 [Puccinia graminis f. sp. tritici]